MGRWANRDRGNATYRGGGRPLRGANFQPRTCRFLEGDDPKTWEACGEPTRPGSPYCEHHHQRCYREDGEPWDKRRKVDETS